MLIKALMGPQTCYHDISGSSFWAEAWLLAVETGAQNRSNALPYLDYPT